MQIQECKIVANKNNCIQMSVVDCKLWKNYTWLSLDKWIGRPASRVTILDRSSYWGCVSTVAIRQPRNTTFFKYRLRRMFVCCSIGSKLVKKHMDHGVPDV